MKEINPIVLTDFRHFLKKKGGYHFINYHDLINLFVKVFYPKSVIIALMDSKHLFDLIPRLTIEKRNNYGAYTMGLVNDMVFIEMTDVKKAMDFLYSIPSKTKIKCYVYENGFCIANEKGKLKNKLEE